MFKIGVVGAGHLGKIHLKILKDAPFVNLVGFFDSDPEVRKSVKSSLNIKSFNSYKELIENSDVVDIVTPTLSHYKCAKEALLANKHVFIEKPVTHTVDEVKKLITIAQLTNRKVQVGHVERFNPAFTEAKKLIHHPKFIEVHRLAQFNSRGTDVSVIHDLMIHDLDIVLHIVKSPIKSINASGVSVLSNTPDIANARIEFENGCVANLTASRISMKNMRKTRFFQKDAYISVNFLSKESEVVRMKDVSKNPDEFAMILQNAEGVKKQIYFENPEVENNNAILDELDTFADAIKNNTTPVVTLSQATEALRVAQMIIDCF